MRRRLFLGTVATGVAVSTSGCLGGDVVHDISDSVRIEQGEFAHWEIDNIESSGEVGYTVRSSVNPFKTFYFTSRQEFETYQQYIYGEPPDEQPGEHPRGVDELGMLAIPNDEGIWVAERPTEGGRYSLDIDDNHYFVVDYSDYHQELPIGEHEDDLRASVALEVVDSHIF